LQDRKKTIYNPKRQSALDIDI